MAKRQIENYVHKDKERSNNPPVGLVTSKTDLDADAQTYEHDPHLSPQLQWASKAERTSFEVPTVSLHVHERVDPLTAIESMNKDAAETKQFPLFESRTENQPLSRAIEFYEHRHNWSNRLIAGDSLLVMNSLLVKEGLARKIQLIYMDPPYGVKYQSNFQPFTTKRPSGAAADRDVDLTREPEMIRAFRDTWELGVHSYLSYLRDRLILARELLSETGSVIVQIGDENVHRVAMIMDELFGAENRVATITFATTSGRSAKRLPQIADYLLWYATDITNVKYHQMYEPLSRRETVDFFSWHVGVELADGTTRPLKTEEKIHPDETLPHDARLYGRTGLDSQGTSTTGRSEPFHWDGREFSCGPGRHWSISHEGLRKLGELGRLEARVNQTSLRWKKYEDEIPGRRISNVWSSQMFPSKKHYVVQTSDKVLERAILMTTDPGDIVFDPTCGSGVSAVMSEKWGRRWITCDTSRVALNIAKHRLLSSSYDYFSLAHFDEGIGSGFVYKTVPDVSPKTLAYDEPANEIVLYDQPSKEKNRQRVTGPFTVEAVPAPVVIPVETQSPKEPQTPDRTVNRRGESLRLAEWCNELIANGIRGERGKRIRFSHLELLPDTLWIHAIGETQASDNDGRSEPVAVVFGPDHAALEQRRVEFGIEQAQALVPKPTIIVFAAFQFDPEASREIDEIRWPGVRLFKVQMNADLLTGDLKKKQKTSEAFWLIGQPDVELIKDDDGSQPRFCVKVHGFDYVDQVDGDVVSGGTDEIAMWMLDPDYDGRSLYPRQIFFPNGRMNGGWDAVASSLRSTLDPKLMAQFAGTQSAKFKAGKRSRAAVKIVDIRGIESVKILNLSGDTDVETSVHEREFPESIDEMIKGGEAIPEHLWSFQHDKER